MAKQFRNRKEAASFLTDLGLEISWLTLQKLACHGGGPAYQIFGHRAIYTEAALLAWAKKRIGSPVKSSSERPEAAA